MTAEQHAKDCAKRILIYLDVDITEKRIDKLAKYIEDHRENNPIIETKTTVIYQRVYKTLDATEETSNILVILSKIADEICNKYRITLGHLKVNSSSSVYAKDPSGMGRKLNCRSQILVDAREEFIKKVKSEYYDEVKFTMIAKFLGYKDHTSVIHLFRNRKETPYFRDKEIA